MTPDIETAKAEAAAAPWGTRLKELNDELTNARLYMLTRYPFWGRLAMKMELMFTEEIETACVRADALTFFNPGFWESLPQKAKSFLIAHELCHLAYMHFDRLEDRDGGRWNRAGDYMINQMLVDSGMEMICDEDGKQKGLLDQRFRGLSDVEIYDILEEEDRKAGRDGYGRPQGKGQGQGQGGGSGQGQQQPGEGGGEGDGSPEKKGFGEEGGDCDFGATEKLKERSDEGTGRHVMSPTEIRNEIVAAVAAAKQRGDCPAGMDRWASELSEPKMSWEELLKNYLDERLRRGSTYAKLNRRTAGYNSMLKRTGNAPKAAAVPLPTQKPFLAPAVIAFDSSGSISEADLTEMASETFAILEQYEGLPVRYICADAAVHVDKYLESVEDIEFKGGGGTSHVPVFDRLNQSEEDGHEPPRVAICFTDLFTEFPSEAPEYDVVWVNIGTHTPPEPPFGILLHRNPETQKTQFISSAAQQRLMGGPMTQAMKTAATQAYDNAADPVESLAYSQPGSLVSAEPETVAIESLTQEPVKSQGGMRR